MKFSISFKTPGVLDYLTEDGLSEEEADEAKEFVEKWVEYGECISVEFDTEKETATVQEVS